jgi:hypothetical protein
VLASSRVANCSRSHRYPFRITMSIGADLSEPDGDKVGHDLSCIAFTDPISKQDHIEFGAALLQPWYVFIRYSLKHNEPRARQAL